MIKQISVSFISLAISHSILADDLDIEGRLMFDYSQYDGVNNRNRMAEQWYIRRTKIDIAHNNAMGWEAKIELDYDSEKNEMTLQEAFIDIELAHEWKLVIGKHKESFGIENTTSSNNISTLERSMVTDAFSPGRNNGISLEGGSNSFYTQIGLFSTVTDENDKTHHAITARAISTPINTNQHLLHLGASASFRNMAMQEYQIDESMQIYRARKIIESATFNPENVSTYATEAAFIYQRASAQTEYFEQHINDTEHNEKTTTLSGYYILFSLFLTDHHRNYKNGAFKGMPSSTKNAWELAARYSHIDTYENYEGVNANGTTLTLNYYYNDDIRIMGEASHSDVKSDQESKTGSGNSLGIRLIYNF